jgi:hypothetical protein
MIFLNPAILFGLLAASIPVLIHLLNLRKLKKIEFSTLAFLKELQKNKIRKIKIKQWLLLALRVSIILFLVTAFARPTLEGIAIGGTTSAAKTTAIFILDDTFSMSVVDGNGSFLNQAKQTISKLINNLQEGDEAALILVSEPGDFATKSTNNLNDLLKKVQEVEIAYPTNTIHSAVVKASKILSESKNFNKEIYILSDFQKENLFKPGSLSDLSQLIDEKVKIYTFNYSGKDVYNVGIDNLKLNTQIFEKDKPVSFDVAVTNYSSRTAENIVLSLFFNKERSAQQSVTLSPGESSLLTLEGVVKETGYVDVVAEIEDDEIIQDNKRYTSLFIPDEIPIGLFYDNEQDTRFIELALTVTGEENFLKITKRNLGQLYSFDLNKFKAILVVGSESTSNLERLKAYVLNGGSVFIMPGSQSSLSGFQILTNGLTLPAPDMKVGNINDRSSRVNFEKVEYQHPVFQNIFLKDEKRSIESPDIYNHFKIFTGGRGLNIISLQDGSSFLSEYKIGKGKILLLNTPPVLSWSDFPLKSVFPPLIFKSVLYLATREQNEDTQIAGTDIEVNLMGKAVSQVKVISPDDLVEYFNIESHSETNYFTYEKSKLTGIYKFYSDLEIIENIAVNADPSESVAAYSDEDDFKDYLKQINFRGNYINVEKGEDPVEIVLQARFGSELWKYFLLIAILIAIVEMAVARNAKKELVEVS